MSGSGGAGAGAGGGGGTGGLAGAGAGAGGLPALQFGTPVPVAVINSPVKDDNATFTADLLQVYFSSDRLDDGLDVWFAERRSRAQSFDVPRRVDVVSSDEEESSPAVALDGRTLWVGSNRAGDSFDIWASSRATDRDPWPEPVLVPELNTDADDIPRPTAMGNTVMPLSSRRREGTYWTYFATRISPTTPFGEPAPIAELELGDDLRTVDGFLTEDGRTFFYSSGEAENDGDLFMVRRNSATDRFGAPHPLSLNTSFDERDPWLSPDGTRFFFTSNREGNHDIFEVEVTLR